MTVKEMGPVIRSRSPALFIFREHPGRASKEGARVSRSEASSRWCRSRHQIGERKTKAIRCLPGGVANRGRSSMLKVWHGPTSTCLCPSEGQHFVALSRWASGSPPEHAERKIATANSGGCRGQHKRCDRRMSAG